MGELEGRIAIVTGAGRGIGFGIANRLCRAGATAIIAEYNPQTGNEAVAKLTAEGFKAYFHQTDVTNADSVNALTDAVKAQFGRIDILVNNAGLAEIGPTETFPLDKWYKQVDVM